MRKGNLYALLEDGGAPGIYLCIKIQLSHSFTLKTGKNTYTASLVHIYGSYLVLFGYGYIHCMVVAYYGCGYSYGCKIEKIYTSAQKLCAVIKTAYVYMDIIYLYTYILYTLVYSYNLILYSNIIAI